MIGKYTIRDKNPETSPIHREVMNALWEYRYACSDEIFDKQTDITFDDFVPSAMLYEVYRRHVATKVNHHYSMPILDKQEFSIVVRECFGVPDDPEINTTKNGQRGIRCMKGPIITMPRYLSIPADLPISGTRVCKTCRRRLASESFPKRYGKRAGGKQTYCKDCRNEHQRYVRGKKTV